MLIRRVSAADFDAIAALTTHYILRTAIHFGTQPVTAAELRADWLASRERFPYAVAVIDGQIAGFAKATAFRTRAAYAWSAELGVYVAPEHQRKGVARALYAQLINVCRAQGFHALVAGIALPNAPSVALHEALGFVPVGTFREIGWKQERWHDLGFWQLLLGSAPAAALRTVDDVWV